MGLNTMERDVAMVGGIIGNSVRAFQNARVTAAIEKNEKVISESVAASANIPFGYPQADWMAPDVFQAWQQNIEQDAQDRYVFGSILLGAYYHPTKENHADFFPIRADGVGHLLTVAPTRSGKGAAQIIPNLLSYQGSMFVIDPKGENYKVTAKGREEHIQDCFRIDPFKVTGDTDHYNPMDFIFNDDDCRGIAQMMLPEAPKTDEFWHNEAVNLLAGLIAHKKSEAGDGANLGAVADLLSTNDYIEEIAEIASSTMSSFARDAAVAFVRKAEKERSAILSTINQFLFVWKNEGIREATSKTDFDLADLKNANAPNFTVYLIIPFDKMVKGYSPFLRVIVNQGIDAMMRDTSKPLDNEPVLFVLDEFANLGAMNDLVASLGYLAGYGARVWMFVQNYFQLRRIYGDMVDHINSETATKSFFGSMTIETAKYVVEQLGETTRAIPQVSKSTNNSPQGTHSSMSESFTYDVQPLITSDKVQDILGDGEIQIVIHQGKRLWSQLMRWYDVPSLNEIGQSQY